MEEFFISLIASIIPGMSIFSITYIYLLEPSLIDLILTLLGNFFGTLILIKIGEFMDSKKNKSNLIEKARKRRIDISNKISIVRYIALFARMRLEGPLIFRIHLFRIGYKKQMNKKIKIALILSTPISLLFPYIMKEIVNTLFTEYLIYVKDFLEITFCH